MRLAIALIMSIAFVQATSAQADPRYQYLQRSNGAPTSKGTSSTNNDDDDHDDDEPKSPTQTIPFDGGLSLFLLAGAGIAAKKRFDKRKTKA